MYSNFRKPIVISNALLFHIFLVFHLLFSPVIIVIASFKGVINASFIAFGFIALLSIFFGRAYCAWFCPGCGVQEILNFMVKKKSKNSKATIIKYFIFTIWISAIIAGYLIHGFHQVDLKFGMTDITLQRKIIMTAGAVLIIIPLTLIFGQFASCKYICWQAPFMILGTKLRRAINLPGLRLKYNPANCTSCKKCNKACSMNIDVVANVKCNSMHTECILCGSCIESCKHRVIKFSFAKDGK